MQKDFITGSLGTKEAVAIIDDVKKKLQNIRKVVMILSSQDPHSNINNNEDVSGRSDWRIQENHGCDRVIAREN